MAGKKKSQEPKKILGLSTLAPARGATHARKRVGRGEGSGHGKTSGKGNKGQKARSGPPSFIGFEGGQMPLQRRLPKVGFTSRKKVTGENVYRVVSLAKIDELGAAGGTISFEQFIDAGIVRHKRQLLKVLGGGELKRKVIVEAHAFSQTAKEAIEKAGGEARIIGA